MLGVAGLPGKKGELELDFRRAWRTWKYAVRYPAVKADFDRDDVFRIIYASPRRRGAVVAHWEGLWPFAPVLRVEGWTPEEIAESIDERVPAQAWSELVRTWLSLPPES